MRNRDARRPFGDPAADRLVQIGAPEYNIVMPVDNEAWQKMLRNASLQVGDPVLEG